MVNAFVLFSFCLWHLVDLTKEMKSVSVMEGDSVTLHSDVTETQKYNLVQWMFGSTRIADINRITQTSSIYDERFKDRLKLNQNGSLTITKTRTTDSGLYQLTIVSRETIYLRFNVKVYDVTNEVKTISVKEGDSVSLNTDVTEEEKYLLKQWMFEGTRIAEVSKLTQTNMTYDGPDGRFRDRLKLDQTGSLTITNTRTTDSGLYQLAVVSGETSYMNYNVEVGERSSSPNCVLSSCAVNNSIINQTEDANITELYQSSSDHVHCCGSTEAVIRLIVSALVGVATVAFLVYDIKSTRSELNRMEEPITIRLMEENLDIQYELSRRLSSRYAQT